MIDGFILIYYFYEMEYIDSHWMTIEEYIEYKNKNE